MIDDTEMRDSQHRTSNQSPKTFVNGSWKEVGSSDGYQFR